MASTKLPRPKKEGMASPKLARLKKEIMASPKLARLKKKQSLHFDTNPINLY